MYAYNIEGAPHYHMTVKIQNYFPGVMSDPPKMNTQVGIRVRPLLVKYVRLTLCIVTFYLVLCCNYKNRVYNIEYTEYTIYRVYKQSIQYTYSIWQWPHQEEEEDSGGQKQE